MTTTSTSYAPTGTEASVADLLLRVGDGDPAAWQEIMRRYGAVVSTTVRSFRLQDADALDATQTTWLRLAEHAHQIQHPERLGGWLATTARRICLRILSHAKRPPDVFDPVVETVADPFADPEQRIIDADSMRRLWNFISELPPRRRTLLRALFTEHPRPYAEVAGLTGIPVGGIGPTRARALAQLRDRLEQHGLGPAAWR
jgi:RNA polymerase sigma factor (sigma-70 family)